jgi:ACS family tartrate transporter-like MFS transporter
VYFGLNVCSYGISLWLPSLIRSVSSASNFGIGSLSAIPYLGAAIAMVLVGHHSDSSGERRWHTSMCALVAALSFAGAAYFVVRGSVAPLMALTTVGAMAQFSMMGPFWAMPTSFLKGTWAAVGIAVINSLGNLGGFVGPYIIGLVKSSTGGFRGGLLVIAAALAIASVSALLVRTTKGKPIAG